MNRLNASAYIRTGKQLEATRDTEECAIATYF